MTPELLIGSVVAALREKDWVNRHIFFRKICGDGSGLLGRRIRQKMSPDELLLGSSTGRRVVNGAVLIMGDASPSMPAGSHSAGHVRGRSRSPRPRQLTLSEAFARAR
jgi:hypothetical protein